MRRPTISVKAHLGNTGFNLYIFSRMRRRALLRNQKPPVPPQQFVEPVGAWNH